MKTYEQIRLNVARNNLRAARAWYDCARTSLVVANRRNDNEMKGRALSFCSKTRRNLKASIAAANQLLGRTV